MKKTLLAALLLTALLGCKKEEDPAPVAPTKRDALTKAPWIQTALTVDPALNSRTDFFTGLDACSKDDLYRYASNGTYTGEEGATKCTTAAAQIFYNGTWRLTQDEQRLLLEYTETLPNNQKTPVQTLVREVRTLTDQELQLIYRVTDDKTGTVYTVTETFKSNP